MWGEGVEVGGPKEENNRNRTKERINSFMFQINSFFFLYFSLDCPKEASADSKWGSMRSEWNIKFNSNLYRIEGNDFKSQPFSNVYIRISNLFLFYVLYIYIKYFRIIIDID